MAVKLLFNDLPQYLDGDGAPYAGAQLFTYTAGTSTKQTTYQDSAGSTPHSDPIILDANGRVPAAIWGTVGINYKLVLAPSTDTDPPVSPIFTIDNVSTINDTSITLDQWSNTGLTTTYVSGTQFTVPGDETTSLHVGRRVKVVDSGGTKYGVISVSAYTTLTTVTVVLDSGTFASPISSLSVGVQTTDNPSEPLLMDTHPVRSGSSDKTKKVRLEVDGLTTGTTRVLTVQDEDGTIALTSEFVYSNVAGSNGRLAFPPKWINGLTYANNAGDATNDIDIAAGSARDATDAHNMILASAITKQSDVVWAVGTNAGGLDTGAVGNNDYYIWLIKRSDTGVVDALFSLSSTAPTMPASYDFKRLIGWFKRDSGAIVAFHTYETEGGGIEHSWDSPTLDINLANALTTARRTDAVKVPLNFSTIAHLNVLMTDAGASHQDWIYCPDQADLAPSATLAPLANWSEATGTYASQMRVRTSATGTIAARSTLATVDLYAVSTMGFTWARRN